MLLPNTTKNVLQHRRHKRSIEVGRIIDTLARQLRRTGAQPARPLEILEFGSGNGFQIDYLKRLGNVIASDIYTSDEIPRMHDVQFVQCSITRSPIRDAQFDVIFSNHVIEHIEDCASAFRELKRIGAPGCVYAFSVPTNAWLLLTIPAQYLAKLHVLNRAVPWKSSATPTAAGSGAEQGASSSQPRPAAGRWRRRLLPTGHGVEADFGKCYRAFKIESWARFFREHNFEIIETRPLLLYGPSEWPLIPTMNSWHSLCSSVLFLMTMH
ncbi:MAG TPA: class I SAM-dependent methyltransferase [Steroidobacteraceae bacterium]